MAAIKRGDRLDGALTSHVRPEPSRPPADLVDATMGWHFAVTLDYLGAAPATYELSSHERATGAFGSCGTARVAFPAAPMQLLGVSARISVSTVHTGISRLNAWPPCRCL